MGPFRSVTWADSDEQLLSLGLQEIKGLDFDLDLTGFDVPEINKCLALQGGDEEARALTVILRSQSESHRAPAELSP